MLSIRKMGPQTSTHGFCPVAKRGVGSKTPEKEEEQETAETYVNKTKHTSNDAETACCY